MCIMYGLSFLSIHLILLLFFILTTQVHLSMVLKLFSHLLALYDHFSRVCRGREKGKIFDVLSEFIASKKHNEKLISCVISIWKS